MITKLRLENFKGHRDTELVLPRFAVLVGDNGSGKTSVLEALRLPGKLLAHSEDAPFESTAFEDLLRRDANHIRLSFDGQVHGQHGTSSITIIPPDPRSWRLRVRGVDASGPLEAEGSVGWPDLQVGLARVTTHTGRVALYRFRADQVAASAYSAQSETVVAEDGAQTAVVLADLKLADDERFDRIEGALRQIVPSLRRLQIRPMIVDVPDHPQRVRASKLYFDFQGAKNVPAHHASQGTLVTLALLTVLHGPDRPSVILLDDFDHALHPRAQMELVRMIKALLELDEFKETQIIATTHSPYVLDEVSPANVIAFALRDDGTVASKPLSEHPDAQKTNGALKAGELWTLDAERDWVR